MPGLKKLDNVDLQYDSMLNRLKGVQSTNNIKKKQVDFQSEKSSQSVDMQNQPPLKKYQQTPQYQNSQKNGARNNRYNLNDGNASTDNYFLRQVPSEYFNAPEASKIHYQRRIHVESLDQNQADVRVLQKFDQIKEKKENQVLNQRMESIMKNIKSE